MTFTVLVSGTAMNVVVIVLLTFSCSQSCPGAIKNVCNCLSVCHCCCNGRSTTLCTMMPVGGGSVHVVCSTGVCHGVGGSSAPSLSMSLFVAFSTGISGSSGGVSIVCCVCLLVWLVYWSS